MCRLRRRRRHDYKDVNYICVATCRLILCANSPDAQAPACVRTSPHGRSIVSVVAAGSPSAGCPHEWASTATTAGINWIDESSLHDARRLAHATSSSSCPHGVAPDLRVVAVHADPNWGWGVPQTMQTFAHQLVGEGVDLVISHSSHHVKGAEVYKGKLIVYGAGDFLNDYEGIDFEAQGHGEFRGDLCALWEATFHVSPTSPPRLVDASLYPGVIKHLRVNRATKRSDANWLAGAITREGERIGKGGTSAHVVEAPAANGDGRPDGMRIHLAWDRI